jgi:hypothetical protein
VGQKYKNDCAGGVRNKNKKRPREEKLTKIKRFLFPGFQIQK